MRAKVLRPRVLLEGVEVPATSIVVRGGVNSAMAASIQVIATDAALRLLPRTNVQVYYRSLDAVGVWDTDSDEFRKNHELLFAGEVVGWTFAKNADGRSIVLQCLDFTSYWDAAKKYYQSEDVLFEDPYKTKAATFSDAEKGSYDMLTGSPAWEITKLLTTNAKSLPVGGLLGGILHVLENLGGLYENGKKFRGLNSFFSWAEIRLHLSRMYGISPQDTTSRWLFKSAEFHRWIRAQVSQAGNLISLREIIQGLLPRIFHDYVTMPCPSYRPAGKVTVPIVREVHDPDKAATKSAKDAALKAVDSTVDALNQSGKEAASGFAPAENAYMNADAVQDIPVSDQKKEGNLVVANHHFAQYRGLAKAAGQAGTPEQKEQLRDEALEELRKAREAADGYSDTYTVEGTQVVDLKPRLQMIVFRPNIYFCPPPRCNVFFPDTYSSFQTSRAFLQEPTRLMITTQNEFMGMSDPALLGRQYYFAPNVPDISNVMMKKKAMRSARFIMPHEVYTGIVPMISNFPDIREYDPVMGATGESLLEKIASKSRGKADKLPYIQRVTNFLFFDARFGARQASLSMPFNPYVACGMPALVLDRYMRASEGAKGHVPTQYLGLVQSVEHTLSVDGTARTSVALSHVRTHNEDEEYLGLDKMKVRVPTGKMLTKRTVKAASLIMVEGHGEAPGAIVGPDVVGGEESTGVALLGGQATVENVDTPEGGYSVGEKGPSGGKVTEITAYQTLIFTSKKGEEKEGFETNVVIEELVAEMKETEVKVPPEEILRPAWFAPIYTNWAIGRDFYDFVLKCFAITDATTFATESVAKKLEDFGAAPPPSLTASKLSKMDAKKVSALQEQISSGTVEGAAITADDLKEFEEILWGSSVEEAVDTLVKIYSMLKREGFDVDALIRQYVRRPVATMYEMLGSTDLAFDGAGKVVGKGTEGFFSRACADLPAAAIEEAAVQWNEGGITLTGKGPTVPMPDAADPRPERYKRVLAYALELRERGAQIG